MEDMGVMVDKGKLEKLISLTYDSNPEVRKRAALELAKIDDPAATLALLELSHDKVGEVAQVAQKLLEERRSSHEVKPLQELFKGVSFEGKVEEEPKLTEEEVEAKLKPLEPVLKTKLGEEGFSHLKKKFYERIKDEEITHRRFIQELLSTYFRFYQDQKSRYPEDSEEKKEDLVEEIPEVSSSESLEVDMEESELEEIGAELEEEGREFMSAIPGTEKGGIGLDKSLLEMIYRAMELSEGDEKVLRKLSSEMKRFLNHQVDIAFRIAKQKFERKNITELHEVKNKMRSIYTGPLFVKSLSYVKGKMGGKNIVFARLLVEDERGGEGVVYIPRERVSEKIVGMKVKVHNGYGKTFEKLGETAIVIGKRGKLIIEM